MLFGFSKLYHKVVPLHLPAAIPAAPGGSIPAAATHGIPAALSAGAEMCPRRMAAVRSDATDCCRVITFGYIKVTKTSGNCQSFLISLHFV